MSLSLFFEQRLALLTDQLYELGSLASRPLSSLGRQCLAHRQTALAEELATLNTLAAQVDCPATAHNTREVAA